jgi:hypothetical protein
MNIKFTILAACLFGPLLTLKVSFDFYFLNK